MSNRLTPSQKLLYEEIDQRFQKGDMYKNYIVSGISGSGKSFLSKKLAESLNFKVINFEDEFGKDFFQKNDYKVIDETIFLNYIEKKIDRFNLDETIILDNFNSIINSIKEQGRVNNLLKAYLVRRYMNRYILVITSNYISDFNKFKEESDKIFDLNWSEEDNSFMSIKFGIADSVSREYKNGHYYTLSR